MRSAASPQPEALQQPADPRLQLAAADAVQAALERQVLAAGGLQVDPGALGHAADGPAHAVGPLDHVDAGHAGGAGVRAAQCGEDLDGGGLTGAVGTEQAEHGPRLHGEAEAPQGVVDQALRMPDVLTGATGSVQPLWERYRAPERARARELLELMGCAHLGARRVGTCSQGERGRVRIARALMPSPRLLLLDEPARGLDLAARELLLAALGELAAFEPELATVVVSHHLEDLPPHTTHALLLAGGEVVAAGEVGAALTGEAVSACFGLAVEVRRHDGRWLASLSGGGAACLAGPPRHVVG